ncbi:MAG: DUF3570 domain-containing protein [Proteobacteria bacterium]|nr:DUF3570 domain-containing protein [Pseudomonadota bacterium]
MAAVSVPDVAYASPGDNPNDNFGPGVSYTQLDSALLVYQESGGRVQAIEPSATLTAHSSAGDSLSVEVIADAVSGATPNGAVPADQLQTFQTPIMISGGHATVTGASGGSTVISLPGVAAVRQYTTAANLLPVDKGFHDHRGAFTFNWSQPLGRISDIGFGGGYSREQDYQAISGNAHIAQTFNGGNTTASLSVNTELDSSFPYGGVPTPLTVMSGVWKKPGTRNKTQLGFVVGLTEVMSRRWLMQLNYSFDSQSGYQNDPYRILSVVDSVSGEPTSYLYESRPNRRQSQSLFWDNKFDFDPFVTDISLRYFKDDWGITSKTAELSERINLGRSFFVEPDVRWYQQSAANFYRYFLVGGDSLPTYASSDTRLGKFTSLDYGMKLGFVLSGRTEFDIRGMYYQQTGDGHPAAAIGQLRQQDLFAGTKAAFVFFEYTWNFH